MSTSPTTTVQYPTLEEFAAANTADATAAAPAVPFTACKGDELSFTRAGIVHIYRAAEGAGWETFKRFKLLTGGTKFFNDDL